MDGKKETDLGLQEFAFKTLMDRLNANLYMTDAETDEIIYMNQGMRQMFGIEEPEGKICWQVLQEGMDGRCPFCPVEKLKEKTRQEPDAVIIWEDTNTKNGRTYENCDSLVRMDDGRMIHMQNSVDITDYKRLKREARMDELTEVWNRRAGKILLRQMLSCARKERVTVSVVMLDINELKGINDTFGHKEGDLSLKFITSMCREQLGNRDMMFRLSGDEFVMAFYGKSGQEAMDVMEEILVRLESGKKDFGIVCRPSFSYGIDECGPENECSVNEVISRADERMYIKKRQYHIEAARGKLRQQDEENRKAVRDFDYDKEHLYDALSESTEDYMYVGNMKTGTFRYSRNMVEEFGLPGQVIPNAAAFWSDKIHPHDSQVFLEANQEVADGRTESHNVEYRARNRYGEWVWLRCRGHMIRDEYGSPSLFAGIISNLGKKNRIDHITGLCNKYEFEREVRLLIEQFPNTPFGILQLGIDNFKNINNLYDRVFGDEVIRILSQKISGIMNENTSLYRMDGDEFCILVKNPSEDDFESIYQKIYHMFQHQQEYNGKKYYCTLSGGSVSYPKDAGDYPSLLKFAGYAMEYSKNQGKNRLTVFSDEILKRKERDLELLELLREDIEHGFQHFVLHYQPQVEASTGKIAGAEALLRWSCDKYGSVPPSVFIPLLERSNLILQAGGWVFRQAVLQCREWIQRIPGFVMSINLSYLQVIEEDFVDYICSVIAETGVPYENVLLELTETYLIREQNQVSEKFRKLQGMGIAVAMDDFGTGYSSLGVLKNTPVNLVKIDQTFVREISSSFDVTFIRFIVALCHDVGKEVCLEGVENQEEYSIVRNIGLEYIQGYFFGRPVTADRFEEMYF